MSDSLCSGCVEIFREVSGLENSSIHFSWSDERLLKEPLEKLDVDSLTLLEFVMKVESAYDVELNEEDVNRCKSVGDLVALVAVARNGSS
jgi:acyl carrier protein